MNTKLTLSIEHEVIVNAKKYAKERKRSLSDLIENYLILIANDNSDKEIELSPIVKMTKGTFTAPKNSDYKQVLADRLKTKYS